MVTLDNWVRDSLMSQSDDLIYKDAANNQIGFVRWKLSGLLANRDDHTIEEFKTLFKVVSTHHSKSVELPVYYVDWKRGFTFVLRYNFYNWNVTIIDNRPSDTSPLKLPEYMHIDEQYGYCFVEGFPEEYIKGKYIENPRAFTFCCDHDHDLYAIVWHIISQTPEPPKVINAVH